MASEQAKAAPSGLIASKGIELFTFRTPNGHKASVLLEELKEAYGIDYAWQCLNLQRGENKQEWFKKINPNGKIPFIVDHDHNNFSLSDSQAILNYLIRLYDTDHKLSFTDPFDIARCDQWLSFSTGELTPNQSAALQFFRFIPVRQPFPTAKYNAQARKAYDVLDKGLEGRDYLVGPGKGKYSVADIANFTFVNMSIYAGVGDLGHWKNLKGWIERILERGAVKRGVVIPFEAVGCSNKSWYENYESDPEFKQKEDELNGELKKAKETFGHIFASI